MSIIDEERLRHVARTWSDFPELRLAGVEHSGEFLRLGHVGVHRERPAWSFGYTADLTDASHFRKEPFSLPSGGDAIAAVFRSEEIPLPADYLAGWVEAEDEENLDAWLAELNAHIHELLAPEE